MLGSRTVCGTNGAAGSKGVGHPDLFLVPRVCGVLGGLPAKLRLDCLKRVGPPHHATQNRARRFFWERKEVCVLRVGPSMLSSSPGT